MDPSYNIATHSYCLPCMLIFRKIGTFYGFVLQRLRRQDTILTQWSLFPIITWNWLWGDWTGFWEASVYRIFPTKSGKGWLKCLYSQEPWSKTSILESKHSLPCFTRKEKLDGVWVPPMLWEELSSHPNSHQLETILGFPVFISCTQLYNLSNKWQIPKIIYLWILQNWNVNNNRKHSSVCTEITFTHSFNYLITVLHVPFFVLEY